MGKRNIDSVCPKCGGKILIDKDHHGWYEQCLQCSYMRDLVAMFGETAVAAMAKNLETRIRQGEFSDDSSAMH